MEPAWIRRVEVTKWCFFIILCIFAGQSHSLKFSRKGSIHFVSLKNSTEPECSSFHQAKTANICHFIKTVKDCQLSGGFIPYLEFPYCLFSKNTKAVGFILLGLWLVYLFVALGITAEEFFCPCLQTIAKTLRMSDSVAGVTLLALGNGAPDIFSVIAAISSGDKDTAPLAFQELFGAGMFVTTMVAGSIQLKVAFMLARRPFMRDLVFYISAVGWTFAVIYRKEIRTSEAIGFIVLYLIYVTFVIIGQAVNRVIRRRSSSQLITDIPAIHVSDTVSDLSVSAGYSSFEKQNERSSLIRHSILAHSYASINPTRIPDMSENNCVLRDSTLIEQLLGLHSDEWEAKIFVWKLFDIIKIPIEICLNLTTPVVDNSIQGQKWNKWLVLLQCAVSPVLCAFLAGGATLHVTEKLELWHILLIIGPGFSILILVFTSKNHCPKFHCAFAFAGFAVSVIWIYTIAQEIVNLLQTFGVAFGLSYAIMGLTFLAWGNSIGDFVSNLTMARHGAPRMAIAACFGGPLLNMMLGVGISCTVSAVSRHGHMTLIRGNVQYIISAAFLAISLFSSLVLMPVLKFKTSKYMGTYLVLLYVGYITISVLHETRILTTENVDITSWAHRMYKDMIRMLAGMFSAYFGLPGGKAIL